MEQQRQEAIDQAVKDYAKYAKKYYDAVRSGDYEEALKWKNILNTHNQESYNFCDTSNYCGLPAVTPCINDSI